MRNSDLDWQQSDPEHVLALENTRLRRELAVRDARLAQLTTESLSKREELRVQRDELLLLSRVATITELSGTIAHELLQALTAILSNAQALQLSLDDENRTPDADREILRDIILQNGHAVAILRRMRALLRKEETTKQYLDIHETIKSAIDLAHGELKAQKCIVELVFTSNLPVVKADSVQIQQVLLNLVMNGCDAMHSIPAGERKLSISTSLRFFERVQVAVTDAGTGIAVEDVSSLFMPFFTTKQDGLGLGLPICRSIIAAHGGELWVSNNERQGATFYFTLPAQT